MEKYYIQIKYNKGSKTNGYIMDISSKGIGFASSKKIKKNTIIDIIPKTGYLVDLTARVVFNCEFKRRSYKYKSGAEFISLNGKQKAALKKFISKIKPICLSLV